MPQAQQQHQPQHPAQVAPGPDAKMVKSIRWTQPVDQDQITAFVKSYMPWVQIHRQKTNPTGKLGLEEVEDLLKVKETGILPVSVDSIKDASI